jgi:hypothetical protein
VDSIYELVGLCGLASWVTLDYEGCGLAVLAGLSWLMWAGWPVWLVVFGLSG